LWDVLQPLLAGVVQTGDAFWAKDMMFVMERHGYADAADFACAHPR